MNNATGYSRTRDIPANYLHELNVGLRQTRTLAEVLAVDFSILLTTLFPGESETIRSVFLGGSSITERLLKAGQFLGARCNNAELEQLCTHPSDSIRGAAAYAIAERPARSLRAQLERMLPLADDDHFGVREWAWLALRPQLSANLDEAIVALAAWAQSDSARLRRFAIEALRPRGVWCKHIEELKRDPARALSLLEMYKAESDPYAQKSASNWLNDAAKTQPAWVQELTDRWLAESASPHTIRLVAHARRSR